jgi:hypothetical protein
VWNNAGNPAANPPPAVVIVRESCTASWSGDSGSCSNGLGNPETGTTYAKSSTGDRLSIVTTNTDDFYVSCSPTASVTQVDPPPSGYPAGSCGVTYSATGYVPKLTFDGVLDPITNKTLLIGQQLTSIVTLGGYTPGGTVTYTWTVNGGDVFADYTATTALATYTAFSAPNTASMACFFKKPELVTVSCKVDMTSPALSFTLTDKVNADKPTLSHATQSCGTFQLRPNATSPTGFFLWGAVYPNRSPWGIFYDAWVETASVYRDLGNFCFAQLITDRSEITDAGVTRYAQSERNKSLDHIFPYVPWHSADPHIVSGSTYWMVFTDHPGFGQDLGANPADPNSPITTETMFKYDADFELYIMYLPGYNGGCKIVPLRQINWFAKGTAMYTAGNTPPWSGIDNGSTFGIVTEYPPHPIWSHVVNP